MNDNYNNDNNDNITGGENRQPFPRTYDLSQSQVPPRQEEPRQAYSDRPADPQPQASFGNVDWQWQPAQTPPEKPPRQKKRRAGKIILSIVGVMLAAAVCFSAGYAGVLVANRNHQVVIQQAPPSGTDGLPEAPGDVLTSAQVAAKVESSVVAITTEKMTTSNYWFGNYVTGGAGSGVIISEDGYILTCAHVIDGASKVTVELSDGKTYNAAIVGSYTNGDIAVIKIEATGLTPAVIADSDQIRQGEACYAVGNPEGRFSGSISDGIVSALNRTITVQIDGGSQGNSFYDMFYGGRGQSRLIQLDVIQMTAAVSPGNSGGALFNDRGQLIGIVSAKSSESDSEGLGFAIPSNAAMEISSQLIATGTYIPDGDNQPGNSNQPTPTSNKAVLGINVQTIDTQTAMQAGIAPGVYVSAISVKSTADAGLAIGDRIVSVDEVMVSQATDVTGYLADKVPGDKVTLHVERQGRLIPIEITLVENPDQ